VRERARGFFFIFLKRFIAQRVHTECKGKGKGKAIPLQAWTDPEGSRMLRLADFMIIGT